MIPCHICGYHPGSIVCSAMHEAPLAANPDTRALEEVVGLLREVMDGVPRNSNGSRGGASWVDAPLASRILDAIKRHGASPSVKPE